MARGFKGNMGQACWGSLLYTDGLMAGIWHVTPGARRRNVRKDVTRQEIASRHVGERNVRQPAERQPPTRTSYTPSDKEPPSLASASDIARHLASFSCHGYKTGPVFVFRGQWKESEAPCSAESTDRRNLYQFSPAIWTSFSKTAQKQDPSFFFTPEDEQRPNQS